ncbi:MAG: DDE-type integrase/transposase/recombinase [Myxococcota bacterium]
MDNKLREAIALFRMGLIGELVVPGLDQQERIDLIKAKAARTYVIPGTGRTKVAGTTLRDWMRLYEQRGFEGLLPPFRCDRGRTRTLAPELADKILALREEDPSRSVHTMLRMLRHAGVVTDQAPVAASTVYRLLHDRGLSRRTPKSALRKDHRAFAFERPNQMWQSDVMYGPSIRDDKTGRVRKTYLVTLLDDATRVVCHAAFCWSERLIDFLPVFRQALLKRGVPDRLFVDNGAAYASTHLSVICASLRIALIHARPFHPQAKGKIERFHRTLRGQLLSQLDLERVVEQGGLQALNVRLWAWLEGEYHRTPHRGLAGDDQTGHPTPLDRWLLNAESLRSAPPDLDEHFLVRQERLVRRDRTAHLNGQLFEAPAEYVDRRVELRYDPARAVLREVHLYERGVRKHTLRRLDLHANTRVRRSSDGDQAGQTAPRPSTGLNFAELVLDAHRDLLPTDQLAQAGGDRDRNDDEGGDQ